MDPALIASLRARAVDPDRATDQSELVRRPARDPLDQHALQRAEAALGQPLPPLLRAVYLEVGNGGFGPGYGLLPLLSEGPTAAQESAVALYVSFCSPDPEDPGWVWPRYLVPFCDWGCAIRSCVDCSSPDGSVVTFDPNVYEPGESELANAFAPSHSSLQAWFSDWLAGVNLWEQMFGPDSDKSRAGINPFTGEPLVFNATKLRRPE